MKFRKQKRIIKYNNLKIKCYYYNYFKSPGLKKYPNLSWVNKDYSLIKKPNIKKNIITKLANNLFEVGNKFNLFKNLNYFIMVPKKANSITNLDLIIIKLIKIIEIKKNQEIFFINNIFQVENYRKFWENKLNFEERKKEIFNKIHLLPQYINFFNNKNVIIIDDIISSGISISETILEIIKNNYNLKIKALCYGSVYKWKRIYK